jgi:hypothetical protein
MKNSEERSQNENPVFGEVLTVDELAERWKVPPTWIREGTRCRAVDPIPHIRLGRYVRFVNSPELAAWWKRRQSNGRKSLASKSSVS